MSVILYNAGKIKSFENLKALAKNVGESEEFAVSLWQDMLLDLELLDEFNYFVTNHTIRGTISYGELNLLDMYFDCMRKYNTKNDLGKNYASCDKDLLVLHTFKAFADLKKNPNYMSFYYDDESRGMDIM